MRGIKGKLHAKRYGVALRKARARAMQREHEEMVQARKKKDDGE